VAGVYSPRLPRGAGTGDGSDDRLAAAVSSGAFGDLVAGKSLSLLVSDATREEPREAVLDAVLPVLRAARTVRLVAATGSHDPRSAATLSLIETLAARLRSKGIAIQRTVVHDAARGPFTSFGSTARGTPILLDAEAMDVEAFVVLSDMKPHYFAGYSCPPKFVFPGLASMEAIEANHALTFDPASRAGFHPWHPDPSRRDNPLAADYVEAFLRATDGRATFALVFGSWGETIAWAEAGPILEATARGMGRCDAISHVAAPPERFAVISPGGHPNDVDLYISQRALELCGGAVEDGGDILFLSECAGGIGPAHTLGPFWAPLRGSLVDASRRPPGPYRLYSHKAVRFARLILRLSALHFHTSIDPDEIASAHMVAVTDPQAVIGEWLAMDPGARILLFDGASKLSYSSAPQSGNA